MNEHAQVIPNGSWRADCISVFHAGSEYFQCGGFAQKCISRNFSALYYHKYAICCHDTIVCTIFDFPHHYTNAT